MFATSRVAIQQREMVGENWMLFKTGKVKLINTNYQNIASLHNVQTEHPWGK